MSSFSVTSRPYFNRTASNQCYVNVLTLDVLPEGPLAKFTRRINFPSMSAFGEGGQSNACPCGLVILKPPGSCVSNYQETDFATPDDLPHLYRFFLSNGYQLEAQLTNMINKSPVTSSPGRLVCMATYFAPGTAPPSITYMR